MMPRITPLVAALATLAAVGALVRPEPRAAADPLAVAASGTAFSQSNSRDGQPILSAPDLNPGQSVSGTVTVSNTGSGALDFALRQSTPQDTPGPDGGTLSPHMRLVVDDTTGGGAPRTVYAGPMRDMNTAALGRLAAGQARTYRFTASLPAATGSIDYRAASTSVAYSWQATESADPAPQPDPAPAPAPAVPRPAPAPAPAPAKPPSSTGSGATPARITVSVLRPRRDLRKRRVRVRVRCPQACRSRLTGSIRIKGRKRAIRLRGTTVRMRAGRWSTATFRLSRRDARIVRTSLRRHRRVTLRVKVVTRLASGRVSSSRRSARIR